MVSTSFFNRSTCLATACGIRSLAAIGAFVEMRLPGVARVVAVLGRLLPRLGLQPTLLIERLARFLFGVCHRSLPELSGENAKRRRRVPPAL
jgi:hypothetical protein